MQITDYGSFAHCENVLVKILRKCITESIQILVMLCVESLMGS